jgi:hypothetical protein
MRIVVLLMKPRHAAALVLVGWYLMMPPNACDLSGACNGKSIFWDAVALFRSESESSRHSEMAWRNRLDNEVVLDAPLSEWHQLDEFETLAECRVRYEENQRPLPKEQAPNLDLAKSELADEGRANPSAEDSRSRANSIGWFRRTQSLGEKCVASDDPRLAK